MPNPSLEENLLDIPDLPMLLERLHHRLDDEKIQRQEFRSWVSDEVKENIKRDTVTKFADYASHGIPEYWIVDPKKKSVEQYLLSDTQTGTYDLFKKVTINDYIESVLLPGFIISVKAIFDAEENALTIQQFLTKIKA